MPEYDAFGRKTGESPLEQPSARAETAAAPVATTASAPSSSSSSSKVFPIMLAAAVVVALGAIGIAVLLLGATEETTRGGPVEMDVSPPTSQTVPASPEVPATTKPGGTAPAPETRQGSLLGPAMLSGAIRAMRVREFGRPVSLRVAADRVDAQLITAKGLLRTVQIRAGGKPRELNATQVGPVPSMPWSAVDPAAPRRLVKAATEREKRPAADVDYLVLLSLDKPTWGLFFKGGTHYQGDAAGRRLRRVN